MRETALVLALLVALAPPALHAETDQNLTGNQLFEACSADELAQQGFCLGYVIGALEGIKWGAGSPLMMSGRPAKEVDELVNAVLRMCLPVGGATYGQYRDTVVTYLTDHPEERHNSARVLAHIALMEAFPCTPPG